MQNRRQRCHHFLRGLGVFAVLHRQIVIRSQVLQGGNWLGEVRCWDLYFVNFIEVSLLSDSLLLNMHLILKS